MIRVCETGRNPTMRHILRTHHVSADMLHEITSREDVIMLYETTDRQAADIYTKGFTEPDKWRHATELINVFSPSALAAIRRAGEKKKGGLDFVVPEQVALQPCEDDTEPSKRACTAVSSSFIGACPVAGPGFAGASVATALFDRPKVSSTYSDFVTFNTISLQKYKSKNKFFPDRRLLELCCSTDSLLSCNTR